MSKTVHYYTKFEENQFYHIYNRTVDKHALFCNEGNYTFFLQRYDAYLSPVIDTYAYCLLGNHFHLLVRIRSMEELTDFLDSELKAKDLMNTQKDLSTLYPEDLTTFQKLSNLLYINTHLIGIFYQLITSDLLHEILHNNFYSRTNP